MGKFKYYFHDRGVGFYFLSAAAFLSLVTSIVYIACFISTEYFSWLAFVLSLVAAAAAVALFFLKQTKWATAAVTAFSFGALLFFIYGIYMYVSVVLVGIDIRSFSAGFIVCSVLFGLSFITSNVSLYLDITVTEISSWQGKDQYYYRNKSEE